MPAPTLTFDLLAFQGLVADWIVADPWFNDIPVITQAVDNVQERIDEAISRCQTFVVVDVIGFRDLNGNGPKPVGEVDIDIAVWECVVLNSGSAATQKRALHTAQVLAALLKTHTWPNTNPLVPRQGKTLERLTDPDCDGYLLPMMLRTGWTYTPEAASILGNQGAAILSSSGQLIQSQ